MRIILFACGFLFSVSYCFAQSRSRIEILVNGNIQTINSEPIRVKNKDDRIEFRIYSENPNDQHSLIDSIRTEGCGIKEVKKNKIVLFSPSQQQQQQQSSTQAIQKKFEVNGSIKPVRQNGYISFTSLVSDITACQGRNFKFELKFDARRSPIRRYANFSNSYTFYYVL